MKKSVFYLALIWGLLASNAMAEQSDVTAYYFHSNVRCSTCRNIERMTKEAIATIPNVKFETVNTDEAENKHFLTDYGLYTKSVVLVAPDGKWKNLDQIWNFVRSEPEFKNYIITETNNFKEKP